jgi:hypothetical protein
MSVARKLAAWIEALRREPDAFDKMPPAERRHLAALCRYIAEKADPPRPEPRAGVLADLRDGRQS